jgi:uncharacterized damage-inducible protein DinB
MRNANLDRRKFMGMVGLSAVTGSLLLPRQGIAQPDRLTDVNINHIGPMAGYTPQIGTLISMLDWISDSVIRVTKKFSMEELDRLHDKDSNSIGALLLHVAATEVIYQDITFNNLSSFSKANKDKWNVAMELGPDAQTKIKGNRHEYYVEAINTVRANTKMEMKKKDDTWLLSGETKDWDWNNYCKWFHVVEHFANHRGQITWYSKRFTK